MDCRPHVASLGSAPPGLRVPWSPHLSCCCLLQGQGPLSISPCVPGVHEVLAGVPDAGVGPPRTESAGRDLTLASGGPAATLPDSHPAPVCCGCNSCERSGPCSLGTGEPGLLTGPDCHRPLAASLLLWWLRGLPSSASAVRQPSPASRGSSFKSHLQPGSSGDKGQEAAWERASGGAARRRGPQRAAHPAQLQPARHCPHHQNDPRSWRRTWVLVETALRTVPGRPETR